MSDLLQRRGKTTGQRGNQITVGPKARRDTGILLITIRDIFVIDRTLIEAAYPGIRPDLSLPRRGRPPAWVPARKCSAPARPMAGSGRDQVGRGARVRGKAGWQCFPPSAAPPCSRCTPWHTAEPDSAAWLAYLQCCTQAPPRRSGPLLVLMLQDRLWFNNTRQDAVQSTPKVTIQFILSTNLS